MDDNHAHASNASLLRALRADGTVWMWGADQEGVLATGTITMSGQTAKEYYVPRRVPGIQDVTAAQLGNGVWMVWGDAPSPKAMRESSPPVLTPSPLPGALRDAIEVGNGIALMGDGTVRTWGSNSFGGLGTGGSVDQDVLPTRSVIVKSLSGITRVWNGGNRGLALKSDGTLYVWGPTRDGVQRVPAVLTRFTPDAAGR